MMKPLGVEALQKYGVNIPGKVEELIWSYYHLQSYASAGQTLLTFFQTPVGQGGLTFADTNMELAGQIPAGKSFIVRAIAVEFFPGETPINNTGAAPATDFSNDVYAVMKSGYVKFQVGSKDYITEGPIGNFPPAYGMSGHAAVATTVAATSTLVDYSRMAGMLHAIIPVPLIANQNFNVTLNWPTAVALPSGVNGRIGVRLLGNLFRNAQ